MSKRYTVAVDFDGVLHSYTTPFIAPHVIPDEPVDGAIEWLHRIIQKFDVVVFSTRCKTRAGRNAMRAWLKENAHDEWDGKSYSWESRPQEYGLKHVTFATDKPTALAYIDDRAIRFDGPGKFPEVQAIYNARPWNRKPAQVPSPRRDHLGEALETLYTLRDSIGATPKAYGKQAGYAERVVMDAIQSIGAEMNIRRNRDA